MNHSTSVSHRPVLHEDTNIGGVRDDPFLSFNSISAPRFLHTDDIAVAPTQLTAKKCGAALKKGGFSKRRSEKKKILVHLDADTENMQSKKKVAAKKAVSPPRPSSTSPSSTSIKNAATAQRFEKYHKALKSDVVTLKKGASFLESKLWRIEQERKEALTQIAQQKKEDMARIHRECLDEHKIVQRKQREEEERCNHNIEVLQETIDVLHDNHKILLRENEVLQDEIEEIKDENRRLYKQTVQFHKSIRKVKVEIAMEEGQQADLKYVEKFLKQRKREYEKARFDADQDIELELDHAAELRRKLASMVELIDRQCHDRALAKAIYDAAEKEFASIDSARVECV